MTGSTHAVVVGGGLAGMLAAAVLARHLDGVTIVERDRLPGGPELRKGLPQARHAHILWSGGARAMDSVLPETTARLLAAGAHHVGVPQQMVTLTAMGWQHRFPATEYIIGASRALIDWVVRDQALAEPGVALLDDAEVVEVCGGPGRVTGVRVRRRDDGSTALIGADLVVDATGRGSRLKSWTAGTGAVPAVEEEIVDTGLGYATRVYRAPAGAVDFPIVALYADYRRPVPGRNGLLLPIEDGRWIVTLSGTRGASPATDEGEFDAFVRSLRHPVIAELLALAEPVSPVYRTRSTANRRTHYERAASWPEGLVVLGDALASFNPVYGHGMCAAAHCAAALDAALRRGGLGPGLAWSAQRAMCAIVDDPWILATSQDIYYPDCYATTTDPRLTHEAAMRRQFAELVTGIALREPVVNAALSAVTATSAPATRFEDAEIVSAIRRGPRLPVLEDPPLTAEELSAVGYEPGRALR
ncbi:FAD-dependent oxidoreductase [Actinomadura sp. 7K507]|uniref:FAD-dependent oxidoreductase n=1 Tax=Actinomadura sp. 7K507 TaxID=2530365 RepID=UPI001053D8EC|nr:FAD-dependent oxidoreductase [Actinomadura sp. 7K507]TDC80025.1 FAD-dependent oxidoreductase [Actinomadura sp. 7K507]